MRALARSLPVAWVPAEPVDCDEAAPVSVFAALFSAEAKASEVAVLVPREFASSELTLSCSRDEVSNALELPLELLLSLSSSSLNKEPATRFVEK